MIAWVKGYRSTNILGTRNTFVFAFSFFSRKVGCNSSFALYCSSRTLKVSSIWWCASSTSSPNCSYSTWASALLALNSSAYFLNFSSLRCSSFIVSIICWRVGASSSHRDDVCFWYFFHLGNQFPRRFLVYDPFDVVLEKFYLTLEWTSIYYGRWDFEYFLLVQIWVFFFSYQTCIYYFYSKHSRREF